MKTLVTAQGADGVYRKFLFNTTSIATILVEMESRFPDFSVISYEQIDLYYIEPCEEK